MSPKKQTTKRVPIARAAARMPVGGLRAAQPSGADGAAAAEVPAAKTAGRPRKDPGAKAKGITVTLWPEELAALDALQAKVSEGLPVEVPRSDLARLAFALLLAMKPQQIRTRLSQRKS